MFKAFGEKRITTDISTYNIKNLCSEKYIISEALALIPNKECKEYL